MICKHFLFMIFLNAPELIYLFCTQSNGFKHSDLVQIILFTTNHLFAHC